MKINVLIFLTVAIVFTACKTGSECKCTAGTIHLIGENNCKSENNCLCQHNIAWERVYGIPVTNPDDVDNFDGMVSMVSMAITFFYDSKLAYIKATIKEIRIVEGNMLSIEGGVFTVGNEKTDYEVMQAILTYNMVSPEFGP